MPGQDGFDEVLAAARDGLVAPGSLFEVVEEEVRGNTLPTFRHRERSLRETLESSARFGDRAYLVEDDRRVGFATHLEMVDRVTSLLQEAYGIEPGNRVAIFAANRWEWVVAFWAIVSSGAIPCAFNGLWTPDEFSHATALTNPSLVIGDGPRLERAVEASCRVPLIDLDTLRETAEADRAARPELPSTDEDDPAVLIFTSGTTGRPKAVSISHRGVVGFILGGQFTETAARVAMGAPVPKAGEMLPPVDDVTLITAPLFHTSMLFGAIGRSIRRGATGVLMPGRFDPERVLAVIERERVTTWMALGSAAPRVCACPERYRYDTSSLQQISVGGAPVSPAVQQAIRDTFKQASTTLTMGYASTESVSTVASIGGDEYLAHPTSTGRIAVTTEVEIRGENGDALPDGELGEIHVRSPNIMLGYWNDEAASAKVLKDGGWLAMGDLGRMIDDRLYIETRARDMILVSAENVSPTEVEHRLEAHPVVVEAAVFAVDDPVTGDAVCAVAVTDADADATPEELAAWCRENLAHYKVPTHWHLVHDPLPRTPSGKLVKRAIRELVERETESTYFGTAGAPDEVPRTEA